MPKFVAIKKGFVSHRGQLKKPSLLFDEPDLPKNPLDKPMLTNEPIGNHTRHKFVPHMQNQIKPHPEELTGGVILNLKNNSISQKLGAIDFSKKKQMNKPQMPQLELPIAQKKKKLIQMDF